MSINATRELDELLSWLENYKDNNIELNLTKILQVAKKANLLAVTSPVITVAGTNGKGSTVATLEAIAKAANLNVASYTSPHLFSFLERIKINGVKVTAKECVASFKYIKSCMSFDDTLTYFEFATLLALHVFKNYKLDLIILEVGLGGRLDAVNIVNNQISIISSISLDHCQYLGNTIAEIAYEKAGIVKANSVVVCGGDEGFETIQAVANMQNAQLKMIGKDFFIANQASSWSYSDKNKTIENLTNLDFPLENAACAIAALNTLTNLGITELHIRQGLENLKVLGRFQIYNSVCEVIFDVAHNPAASIWLAKKINSRGIKGKLRCVVGICSDKDWQGIIKPFVNIVDCWYPIEISNSRLLSAAQLTENIKSMTLNPVASYSDTQATIAAIFNASTTDDKILIFGSFFTVSAAMKIIYEKN